MSILFMPEFYSKTGEYVLNLTIKIPVQLDFVRKEGVILVSKTADISQNSTLGSIETACAHIRVLRLYFHLQAAALFRPGGRAVEQLPANPTLAADWQHTYIP